MNDTKWEKLIDEVTDEFEEVFVNYKLIYSEEVYDTIFYRSDFKPFFIEPTLYKEVEWIEFPLKDEDYVNRNNLKAGKKLRTQNVNLIAKAVNTIGQFEVELTEGGLKIYAYR